MTGNSPGTRAPPTQAVLREHLARLAAAGAAPGFLSAFRGSDPPGSLADGALPDLRGRSVLDVGSNLGLRCFEAVARGATRVVGIDANPDRVQQARALADALGYPVEFLLRDADEGLPGEFDVVCCFDVLHRSADPVALVRRLAAAAREALLVETPALDHSAARGALGHTRDRRGLSDAPVIVVARNGPNMRYAEARFYIGPEALRRLLLHHQARFASVDAHPAARAGSFRALARSRHIDRLVVIAGASGVGKSTFIERCRSGDLPPDLTTALDLPAMADAPILAALDVPDSSAVHTPRLWFHYDLNRATRYPALRFRGDDTLQLVQVAAEATCVTLWAPADVLRDRKSGRGRAPQGRDWRAAVRRLVRRFGPARSRPGGMMNLWEEQQRLDGALLGNPALLASLYREWLDHSASLRFRAHWVVDTSVPGYRAVPAARAAELIGPPPATTPPR